MPTGTLFVLSECDEDDRVLGAVFMKLAFGCLRQGSCEPIDLSQNTGRSINFHEDEQMELKFKLLRPGARVPERAYNSAGYDLFACEDTWVNAGERVGVNLGIASEFPVGCVALVWDKSSTGAQGIRSLAGVIDADYRGEWVVWLLNTGRENKLFKAGQKVAQFLLQAVEMPTPQLVETLSETKRGEKAYGSSGS